MQRMASLANRVGIVGELLGFFWQNKWWWLTPMVMILLLLAVLIVFVQSSVLSPFIYTLF